MKVWGVERKVLDHFARAPLPVCFAPIICSG
jgi:hypothetical protein